MQEIDSTLASSAPLAPRRRRSLFRRLVGVYYILLGLLLLALIPPLISVNRYQRRIALSIKALTKKTGQPEAEGANEEQFVHRKTSAFQKMLKKFLKKTKTDGEEDEDID